MSDVYNNDNNNVIIQYLDLLKVIKDNDLKENIKDALEIWKKFQNNDKKEKEIEVNGKERKWTAKNINYFRLSTKSSKHSGYLQKVKK